MLLPLILLIIFLSGVNADNGRPIEYSELITCVKKHMVRKVAIEDERLFGLLENSLVPEANFPGRYDFVCNIGSLNSFMDEARAIIAREKNMSADQVTTEDIGFRVVYLETQKNAFLTIWLPSILPVVIIIVFWVVMMRQQNANANRAMTFGRSKATIVDPSKNKITFADVAGAKEEKEELAEIVDFLKNPKKYTDLGAHIPTGTLMVGPPGTGKTLLAKAVAGEAKVPFFSISGSDFVEMFVGMGASRVRDLFEQAKKNAPCIVFIDEIDAVGRHRGAGLGGGHDEREQTLNQLLVEMDGFTTNEGVIVLAATNRRDILDPALLRPGRFDRQVTVNYPDLEGRRAILDVHAKGKPLAQDVDLNNIAKRTPYATGADLKNIMNEGAIQAAREKSSLITMANLVEAVERVQMGPEKKSHHVLEEDRRITAIHEAGHAIAAHFLEKCDDVHLITIVPRGKAAGFTLVLPEDEYDHETRSAMLEKVTMMLAGRAAESIINKDVCTGASSDLKRATDVIRAMVTEYGMSEKLGNVYLGDDQEVFVGMEFGQSRKYGEETASCIDAEVRGMLNACYENAVAILNQHSRELKAVADALIEKETLGRDEFLKYIEEDVPEEKS